MRPVLAVLVGALVVGAVGPVAADEDNSPPLADAGLDRWVVVGETVLLDGGGSTDPDGEVAAVEWRIEAPNGTTRAPACADCSRTWFAPDRPGVYEVTLAVTDDDGARRTDHLRVVVDANARPQVTVDGPSQVQSGTEATYTATVSSEDPLRSVVWTADGREFARTQLSGNRTTTTASVAFESPGQRTVRATVSDVHGDAGVASLETSVSGTGAGQVEADRDPGGGRPWNPDTVSRPTERPPQTASPPPPGTAVPDEPTPDPDFSQPSRRGEWVAEPDDPEPEPAPAPGGNSWDLVDDAADTVERAVDGLVSTVERGVESVADAVPL